MSEMEAVCNCKICKKDTIHIYSGSGRRGVCCECGNHLPEEERADLKRVISYNG